MLSMRLRPTSIVEVTHNGDQFRITYLEDDLRSCEERRWFGALIRVEFSNGTTLVTPLRVRRPLRLEIHGEPFEITVTDLSMTTVQVAMEAGQEFYIRRVRVGKPSMDHHAAVREAQLVAPGKAA